MHSFEITIQRRPADGWSLVVKYSQPSALLSVHDRGDLQLDLEELMRQRTARDYGTVLGKALFHNHVRDGFIRARAESKDRLHVLLSIEAPDLRTLRWERLCAPLNGGWDFLALDQRVPFSLYLPSAADRRFPPIGRRDLRALVLAANPQHLDHYRLAPFDSAATVAGVQTALGPIPSDVLATLPGAVGSPTLDALCEHITAGSYTLLHMVCHGRYIRQSGDTVLYLATEDDQVDPVTGTRLLERLGRLRGAHSLPHLAFLSSCESASPEAEEALGGLGQRLVRELGMPAVVAMTAPISIVTAQAFAAGFYRRLREHGEVDLALNEACAGLAERYDITVPALYSRLGGRPLFSNMLDRPLTTQEIAFGIARLTDLLSERAPVLCPAFDARAAALRGMLNADPLALSSEARYEREEALNQINAWCEEVLDLSLQALALGQDPPLYDSRCPFCGLSPFRTTDREFFFGREDLIARLERRLTEHNFLAVLGPSGSGKSSVLLAGLIPVLQKHTPEPQVIVMTPGNQPLAQLEASLATAPDRLGALVVDQFEELFTAHVDVAEQQAFLNRLIALADRQRVIITMREDFVDACEPFPDMHLLLREHQELIVPMEREALQQAIALQAASVGLRFEVDLMNTILDDVHHEPGAMPLLQHALLELWRRRHGRWLSASEYRAIGGVRQAIARTADTIYEQLSLAEQQHVKDIFIRLTRLDDEAPVGKERRDVRRRVELEELSPVGGDPDATRMLVNRLADARLLVTSMNSMTRCEEVEVAHEALIAGWPRFRGWLGEDRTRWRMRERISDAAREWERAQRDPGFLVHRGGRLAEARMLGQQAPYALNARELSYLDACSVLQEREVAARRDAGRLRWLVVALVLVTLAGFSFLQALRLFAREPMASLTGGPMMIGAPTADAPSGEVHSRSTDVAPFNLERHEVTNRQYWMCVLALVCDRPKDLVAYSDAARSGYPVVHVTAFDAARYCAWIGRRLPTETEWEWAARGGAALRPWPWGTELPDPTRLNVQFGPGEVTSLQPADSYPKGATPESAIFNMAGNAMEWTASIYQHDPSALEAVWKSVDAMPPATLVVRGGSFKNALDYARSTARLPASPAAHRDDLGFRCATDGL